MLPPPASPSVQATDTNLSCAGVVLVKPSDLSYGPGVAGCGARGMRWGRSPVVCRGGQGIAVVMTPYANPIKEVSIQFARLVARSVVLEGARLRIWSDPIRPRHNNPAPLLVKNRKTGEGLARENRRTS